jgi:hypothetical protein
MYILSGRNSVFEGKYKVKVNEGRIHVNFLSRLPIDNVMISRNILLLCEAAG